MYVLTFEIWSFCPVGRGEFSAFTGGMFSSPAVSSADSLCCKVDGCGTSPAIDWIPTYR